MMVDGYRYGRTFEGALAVHSIWGFCPPETQALRSDEGALTKRPGSKAVALTLPLPFDERAHGAHLLDLRLDLPELVGGIYTGIVRFQESILESREDLHGGTFPTISGCGGMYSLREHLAHDVELDLKRFRYALFFGARAPAGFVARRVEVDVMTNAGGNRCLA